jgi:Flp pilus assembly protein TadG
VRLTEPDRRKPGDTGRSYRGMAAVELAFVIPPIVLIFMGIVDYARVFSDSVALANCARNGAFYASDPAFAASTPYASLTQAATADASNLSPAPTVTSVTGTDAAGKKYVDVTVSYTFHTIATYPGIPNPVLIGRTARMPVAPP